MRSIFPRVIKNILLYAIFLSLYVSGINLYAHTEISSNFAFLWLAQEKDATSANSIDTLRNAKTSGVQHNGFADTNEVNGIEEVRTPEDSLLVFSGFESTRLLYSNAMRAIEEGDTVRALWFFVTAKDTLNYLLENVHWADSLSEFSELDQAIHDDFRRIIASMDVLPANAPFEAVREKLALEVEVETETPLVVPRHDITDSAVPLVYNDYVGRALGYFLGRGRDIMERWLVLEGRYMPMMKQIFREEGVPLEMVYLSMPESGLRSNATSWARAVGLWQFMRGTGKLYGLRQTYWFDERRDFEKSTRAAARHLKDLYEEFNDWYLVLSAYNAGAGRVYRGIRRSNSVDYWEMRRFLPRETRNYVPQFIAVTRIVLNPEAHGFINIDKYGPLAWDTVHVHDAVDLAVLAKAAGTTLDTLRMLNPELLQWCTPPGVKGYRLRIPVGQKDYFAINYEQLPNEHKKNYNVHQVRAKETMSGIARRYGLTLAELREANEWYTGKRLRAGSTVVVPIKRPLSYRDKVEFVNDVSGPGLKLGGRVDAALQAGASSSAAFAPYKQSVVRPKDKVELIYIVKKGDALSLIAQLYGVRTADIRNWNDISYRSKIYPGQELSIWVSPHRAENLRSIDRMNESQKRTVSNKPVVTEVKQNPDLFTHIVKRNETLGGIAKKYGVTVSDLRQWNSIRGSTIRTGQRLRIEKDTDTELIAKDSKPSASVRRSSSKSSTEIRHKVRKGETLWDISQSYDVPVASIKKQNNLRSPLIKAGQILIIPIS